MRLFSRLVVIEKSGVCPRVSTTAGDVLVFFVARCFGRLLCYPWYGWHRGVHLLIYIIIDKIEAPHL